MTEQHECKWIPKVVFTKHGDGKVQAWCRSCPNIIDGESIKFRLNEYETLKRATEALTAEDAKSSSDILSDFSERLAECQKAYADILKDG